MATDLVALRQAIQTNRSRLDQRVGEARALARRGKMLQEQTAELSEKIKNYDKAVLLLTTLGEERQQSAQRQIEELVTSGLQTIFGQSLSFHLVQNVKANRPEVDFVIRSQLSNGKILDTSPEQRGGGYRAVIGVLLRIVILLLQHKDKDTPLILDESFAHLSDRYIPAMAEFLKELVRQTSIQIVLVTHQRDFGAYADKIYDFTNVDGVTRVKELVLTDV